MGRIRRKATMFITTPDNKRDSDMLVDAVNNAFKSIASNYDIEGEQIISFYNKFTKAPNEIIGLLEMLTKKQEKGLFEAGTLITRLRKKLMQ